MKKNSSAGFLICGFCVWQCTSFQNARNFGQSASFQKAHSELEQFAARFVSESVKNTSFK